MGNLLMKSGVYPNMSERRRSLFFGSLNPFELQTEEREDEDLQSSQNETAPYQLCQSQQNQQLMHERHSEGSNEDILRGDQQVRSQLDENDEDPQSPNSVDREPGVINLYRGGDNNTLRPFTSYRICLSAESPESSPSSIGYDETFTPRLSGGQELKRCPSYYSINILSDNTIDNQRDVFLPSEQATEDVQNMTVDAQAIDDNEHVQNFDVTDGTRETVQEASVPLERDDAGSIVTITPAQEDSIQAGTDDAIVNSSSGSARMMPSSESARDPTESNVETRFDNAVDHHIAVEMAKIVNEKEEICKNTTPPHNVDDGNAHPSTSRENVIVPEPSDKKKSEEKRVTFVNSPKPKRRGRPPRKSPVKKGNAKSTERTPPVKRKRGDSIERTRRSKRKKSQTNFFAISK